MWLDPTGNVHVNYPDDPELSASFADLIAMSSDHALSRMRLATRLMSVLSAVVSGGSERYNPEEDSFETIEMPAEVVGDFTYMWRQKGWAPALLSSVDARWRPDLLVLLDETMCDELDRRGIGYFDVVDP